jgi:hypothetical protein
MVAKSSIAILFFSRQAEAEASAKPWLGRSRRRANVAVARLLIAQSQAAIAGSGFDPYHFTEQQQRGSTFGERLAMAISDVFALGYRAVVAVGNDAPALEGTDWIAVAAALQAGKTVVGPTMRGGAYLIGLQACDFDAATFAALPWQTSAIYDHLHAAYAGLGLLALPKLRDINTLQDLQIVSQGPATAFVRSLRLLLGNHVGHFYLGLASHGVPRYRLRVRPPPHRAA